MYIIIYVICIDAIYNKQIQNLTNPNPVKINGYNLFGQKPESRPGNKS